MATAFSNQSQMLSCLTQMCQMVPITDDIIDLLPDKHHICRSCDEVARATSRCTDCNELLCFNCVRAHIRVQLTKDHCILLIDDLASSSSSSPYSSTSTGSSMNSPTSCDLHFTDAMRMYCQDCNTVFCHECNIGEHINHRYVYIQDAVEGARRSSLKLLTDAKMSAQAAKECLDLSQGMMDKINIRTQMISQEMRAIMRRFQQAIETRERVLINKIERIRVMKYKSFQQQVEGYRTLFSCFTQSTKALSDALEIGGQVELIQVTESISSELKRLKSIRSNMPQIDDLITIVPPDVSVLMAIASLADVTTSGYTPTAIGEEITRNAPSSNRYQPKKKSFLDVSSLMENLPITQENPFNEISKFSLWTGNVRTKDPEPRINLLARPPAPRAIQKIAATPRDYTESTGHPCLVIGNEGDQDGQLCRPWGVCCTTEGNIIVADRSNNRIQIFRSDGSFLRSFGSQGPIAGQFDRPAGVASDSDGRIIVTDKDNHRVQVFKSDGTFIFKFGEKGSKVTQFNYPWDVDVDSKGRIVVADTRNHRIQLFDRDGMFIAKYGFENVSNMIKHFDSPRGVCFGVNGCVIVTDFNNHRLVVIDPNFRNAKFLGCEGIGAKQFLRPQGVAVDIAGNIIVADSRNNRIQIFEPSGGYLCEFGSSGRDLGQFDRPSGLCLTPTGKIAVVDFGNNRVQIF